jgi:signal transduction histidine kinase
MPESPPRNFRVPPPLAVGLTLVSIAGIALIDYYTSRRVNGAILYSLPLIVAAAAMSRRLIWSVAALGAALTLLVFWFEPTPLEPWESRYILTNRLIATGELFLLAGILHAFVGTYQKLERGRGLLMQRRAELERTNAELAAREEEITRQNEELQSQTEELERQGEELRVANEQLERRERALEVLLSLSRSLTADLSRAQTTERICRTLGLILGHGTAAAILLRDGEDLRIVCHHNFGAGGPESESVAFARSFAGLILERNRTGYLEDLSLRPELHSPQPREGARFRSVLASPLRVNGHAVGSLEAYSTEPRAWTDEQIATIESLAAQTSTSLQAAELYERIDQERQRLRAVLRTVPFSIEIANADMSDVRINPAGAALRGVPADTNLVRPDEPARCRLLLAGQPVAEEQMPLRRAVERGEVTQGREYELVVDGARRHTLLVSAAPIRDAQGRVIGGVSASVDVTAQKKLQLELDARRREAEEASARKTRFLAAVSHDIRTPANAISLLAELMQRTASAPGMQAEIPEIAADLRHSAMTLVSLVSDVLDLTRFDAGRIDLEESEFPLEVLVNDECRQLGALARDKGLEFTCRPPPPSLVVRADRVKLSRILGNLISNAVKFTERGGVTVAAGTCDAPGEHDSAGGVWVRVSDTGPGVPPEYRERIFDEFFQLKQAGAHNGGTSGGGSGLGLAICRRLAEAMGGTITVDGSVGKGSTFTLTLPRSAVVAR